MITNELLMKIIRIDTDLTPSRNTIFEKGNRKSLGKKETEELHTSVARVIIFSDIVRPYIHQTAAVLSTRVKEPHANDRKNSVIMIKYLMVQRKITLL